MNDQNTKVVSRGELYRELWTTPLSKLAGVWGVSIYRIVRAADDLGVPRPDNSYWGAIQHGLKMEWDPLPATESGPEPTATIARAVNRQRSAENQPDAKPDSLAPAVRKEEALHPFVRQTRRALTSDTYVHHGHVCTRSGLPRPLYWVTVSPAQLDRALGIVDRILKGAIALGGKFVAQREQAFERQVFYIGKQEVPFRLREATKRSVIELTKEAREKRGLFPWDRYEWTGSGRLRLTIGGAGDLDQKQWEESSRTDLNDLMPDILDYLGRVEGIAEARRLGRVAREKLAEEESRRYWQQACARQVEEERRKSLEALAEKWWQAKRLRQFIEACEQALRNRSINNPEATSVASWVAWASQHAERIDPIANGALQGVYAEHHRQASAK